MNQSAGTYIRASEQLKSAIDQNSDDTAFADKENEIVYLFDTNVVEAYLRGDSAILGGHFGSVELFTQKAADVSSRLTLNYLFSGALPGQSGSIFLSPMHWNESLDRAAILAGEQTRSFADAPPLPVADLSAALEQLLPHKDSPSALIEHAEKLNLGATFVRLAKAVSVTLRLKALYAGSKSTGEPRVRDIAQSGTYWPPAMNAVRADDVTYWDAKISAKRAALDKARAKRGGQTRRGEPLTRNVYHDAMTLAAIQALYRENPEAGGVKPRVRFVLVSADTAMGDVLVENADRLEREGIPAFLRHPRVYMPLLNFSGMHQSMKADSADYRQVRKVFSEVEQAVKALFPFGASDTTASRYSRYWRVAENIERWSAAAESLVVVNGRYFVGEADHNSAVFEEIMALLQQPDVLAAAAQGLSETLAGIRGAHTSQASVLAFERLLHPLRRAKRGKQSQLQRAPLKLIDVDVLAPLRNDVRRTPADQDWLDRLLDRLREEPQFLGEVVERLKVAWDSDSQARAARLMACCIYFSAEAWDSARECADLCLETLRRNDRYGVWAREARYCKALALRMSLRSRVEVDEARRLLTDNVSNFDASLATPRDRVERAALMLTATVVQTIVNSTPQESANSANDPMNLVPVHQVKDEFDLAVRDMKRALDELEGYEADNPYVSSRVRLHATVNLLGAEVYGLLLKTVSDEAHSATSCQIAAQRVREDLRDLQFRSPPAHALLYLTLADYLGDPNAERASEALNLLKDFPAQGMSWADLVEHRFLSTHLKAGLIDAKPSPELPVALPVVAP